MMKTGGMTADYGEVARISDAVTAALIGKQEIVIETAAGTRLRLGKTGREPAQPPDNGLFHKPGEWGNLPAGEAFPWTGTRAGWRRWRRRPMACWWWTAAPGPAPGRAGADRHPRSAGAAGVSGRSGHQHRGRSRGGSVAHAPLDRHQGGLASLDDPAVYTVGEFGIGTNPASRFCGITVEDEKILGTAHVAIGRNTGFGGVNMAPIHLDFVITKPTIRADGDVLMADGQLKV